MSVQNSVDRLNAIKARIRTNLVAQGIAVPEDTVLEEMAEQILSVAGEPGPKGDTGATGPKGDTGDAGADGKTPVKGVDYFTAAEKAEMASEAAAAIPISNYVPKSGTTMTGALIAQANTGYTTRQVRNVIYLADGASVPTTQNGDLVLFYK